MDSEPIDLKDRLSRVPGPGAIWTHASEDLNVNLLRFDAGQGVPRHVNAEIDVLLVVIEGQGILEVDGVARQIGPGTACVIPKGATRAIRSAGAAFAYLTCHRRRGGLWPAC